MTGDERPLLPLRPPSIASVGAPSRLIARGVERLQRAERRYIELPTPAGAISRAHAINNRGQIVGLARWPDDQIREDTWGYDQVNTTTRAVVWEQGRMTVLETGALMDSRAFDINDYGDVVGIEYLADSPWGLDDGGLNECVAVLWQDGERIVLGPNPSFITSYAYAMNNCGQIVGAQSLGWRDEHVNAVLWESGRQTLLEPLELGNSNSGDEAGLAGDWEVKSPYDGAFGLNDQGVIVGMSHGCAVVWRDGKVRELDLSPSRYSTRTSDARDINEQGQIVGTVWPSANERRGWNGPPLCVLWQDDLAIELVPTDSSMDAPHPWQTFPKLAINNLGQVVGLQSTELPDTPWMWDGHRMIELAKPTSTWAYASDINDRGLVVGNCEYGNGVSRACLWE